MVMKGYGAKLLLIILLNLICLFAEARDFYWIGGSGNFNDIQHWSDQPGGKVNPDALLPDKDDNVFFDQYSFTAPGQEVIITNVARCANMHWGDVKHMPTLKTDDNPAHYLVVYGGVTFNEKMILDLDRPLYFRASSQGNEIDFGGKVFDGDIYFENDGGWRIASSLNIIGNNIYYKQGTLSVEADLHCGSIISENSVSRELFLNSSTIYLNKGGESVLKLQTDNLTIHPEASEIIVESNNSRIELLGNKRADFNKLRFSGDNGFVDNSSFLCSINNFTFEKNGELKGANDFGELMFTEGYTYTIHPEGGQNVKTRLLAMGKCYAFITIKASTVANILAEEVELDYLKVQNINAGGNAANFAAPNSYNLGGNTNWNFTAPAGDPYTWTGAAGDNKWGNYQNWNLNCVPSRNNDVIIPSGKTVDVDIPAECKSLTIDNTSTFQGSGSLEIFGSLNAGNSNWTFGGETRFKGDLSNTISINVPLNGPVIIDGDGTWTLAANLEVDHTLELMSGSLITNSFELMVDQFISNSTFNRTLNIDGSDVKISEGVSKAWHVEGGNFKLFKNASTITFLQAGAEMYNKTSDIINYGKVLFKSPDEQVFLTNEETEPSFEELKFNGSARISGNHQFYKLTFSEGKEYLLQEASEQKILTKDGLIAQGSCANYISLKGDNGIAFLNCSENSDFIEWLRIEDVNVKGGLIDLGNKLIANESIGVSGFEGWDFVNSSTGATINWTGAIDDDWFTAGNWSEGCIPTRVDNVVFDEANLSGAAVNVVTINRIGSIAECKDMTWKSSTELTFTGGQPMNCFGSMDLSGLTEDNCTYSGDIDFKSELPVNLKTGVVTLIGDLNFTGNEDEDGTLNAGSWTLQSDLLTEGKINIKKGDFISGNFNIEAKEIYSNYGTDFARSLTLGSSTVKVERMEISAEALSVDAGTSTIEFLKGGELIVSEGTTTIESIPFNNVLFSDPDVTANLRIFADDVSFNNMTFKGNTFFRERNVSEVGFTAEGIEMAVGKSYVFESLQTYIVGNIIADGACEGTIDITASRSDAAILQKKTGASDITVSKVNILNVHADPANDFIANESIDLGNAIGWRFKDEPSGRDLYWIGGTGRWDDPKHWATSSGSLVADGCVPTAKDNVFFDNGSFNDTDQTVYTGASDIRCRSMNWTNAGALRPNFVMGDTDISGVYIYGSLIFDEGINIDLSPMVNFYFRGTEPHEINAFGYTFPNKVEFDGKDGQWTLLDSLKVEGDLFVRHGKLVTDGKYVECKSITSIDAPEGVGSRGLDIRRSKVVVNGTEDIIGKSLNINLADAITDLGFELISDESTIIFPNDASVFVVGFKSHTSIFNELIFEKSGEINSGFTPNKPYYGKVHFKGNGKIVGENQFGDLELGRGFDFEFQYKSGRVYQMENLIVNGSCFAPISIHSSSEGKQFTILSANDVNGNFLQLKDINADKSAGATYTATNSFAIENVSGWTTDEVIAPIALYWTGKGIDDDWNNHENWSRAADGGEEGCVPTVNDDVFFTENSFLGSKHVEVNSSAKCHNMTWEDDVDPAATFIVNSELEIGGFMDLTTNMELNMSGSFVFVGDGQLGDKMVDFADKTMDGDIHFQGEDQSWVWESKLITSGDLFLESGSVSTQENDFTIGEFTSLSLEKRKFDMSGSLVHVTSDEKTGWNMIMKPAGSFDFITTNSKITFDNGGGIYCQTDGEVTFGFVDFMDNGVININSTKDTERGKFGSVAFFQQGEIYGNSTYSNLQFTLGYEDNIIETGKTITVENDLKMEGVRCSYIFLRSSKSGEKAFLHKPTGIWSKIYNAAFTDIAASTGSGVLHPVKYHYEGERSTGFELFTEDADGDGDLDEDPPSFEDSFDLPREEYCSNYAVLDHVERFPINSNTTFQWYYSVDGTPGSYASMDGQTNAVVKVEESGFYKVLINYGVNKFTGLVCELESVIEVVLGSVSTVSLEITANNVRCFGEGNGSIIAKVKENPSGNYPDYSFFWKAEDGSDLKGKISTDKVKWESTGINLSHGKYYITVADSKNCTFDTIVNVFDAYELLIDDIDTKDLTCYTDPTGEILISASGGTGDLSYYLNDELQAGANITGLFSGDHVVYVKDANECLTDEEPVILNSEPKINIDLNAVDLSCFGDKDGTFSPVVSGGVPDYTYSWSGPGFTSTDKDISDLAGGSYTFTVTDAVSCVADTIHVLVEPEQLTTKELIVEPANCHGESSGEIFVVGDKGTPGYTYYLDGTENAEGKFYGVEPVTHELQIVDANGCTFTKEVEVEAPQQLGFFEEVVMPSCDKKFDGAIHVKPYGGNEGYKFSWTGPNDYRSRQMDIENLESGEYQLMITDKKNCAHEATVDLNLGLPLQLGVVVEQHITKPGANDGSLAVEIIEGTAPYTFTITGPGVSISSPDNFDDHYFLTEENLPGGVYTVVATDFSGCATVEKSVIIEEPGRLYAYIEQVKPVGCPGSADGELRVIVQGGDGTYTYNWSGPSTGSGKALTGLTEGTYTVNVSSGGQTISATYTLLPANPVVANVASFKNVSCINDANGEITLDVDAGGVNYEIEWTGDNGFLSSSNHIIDLEPGTYTYKVITEYGCESAPQTQVITQPTALNLNVTPTDLSKVGERDGKIRADFGGGTPPYTVMISGPGGWSYAETGNTSGTVTVGGLEMGNYEVVVLDANECRIEDLKKVHEPEKLLLTVTSKTNVTCPGGDDGAIEIGVEGASDMANVTYSWAGDNFFRSTDKDISNLKAGRYELNIHDSKGDLGYEDQSIIVFVTEPKRLEVEYWKKDITCHGSSDGYINIHPKGGTPSYTYLWTGVEPFRVTKEDQANLAPGTYTVRIADANGCAMDKDTVIVIEEPDELQVSVSGQKDPTCYGFENGWINLDITSGTAPYIISWDNYGSVTQNIKDLEKGDYHYVVTDDKGCSKADLVTLNEPDTLIAQINDYHDVLCHGDGSGRAFVDIQGGTPDYDILWSDGQDTQEATDLKLGTYEVKIVDAQGCTDISSVEIFEPEPLAMKVEAIRPTTYEAMDGELNVKVTGGVADYVIAWTDQDLNAYSGDKLTDLERGTYELTITDNNKCELDSTIVLEYLFERRIRIPKAFTPNADGYNDYWDIERIEFVQDLKIVIYDRWGKTVYKFSGTGNEYKGTPWKGVDGSKNLPVGSYYYAVEVDDEKPIRGTVTILR
eukprot:TRINITY_DN290812_c0_g1_i1.p1 TRINITY_DN290812_c0_g1~~TRINITY_DN290812_c0_g1_i1.p1  ORF type:complete len:3183 (+),score=513.36 TRINITY_DN290812_c0_g1_i1:222-9770(+)